jgi:Uracil-DNA glycosylase
MRQLALINPDLVVPMGQWATWDLFELFGMEDRPFRDVRGKAIRVTSSGKEWVLHPTFHPAVITHNPNLRKGLEQDFRSLAAILRELPVRRD